MQRDGGVDLVAYMRGRNPESAEEIGKGAGLHPDTARRRLRMLEAQGHVRSVPVSYGPNLWRTNDPDQENCAPNPPSNAPTIPSGKVLSSRVELSAELHELEKRIAADTVRRAEILEQLR
jgi:DNA-binding Lrp family transcriptional regulator